MAMFVGYNAPFRQGLQNVLSLQADERLIKNDLLQLLLTAPGERVMRPDYGSPIRPYLFENMDDGSLLSLKEGIKEAIEKYERRVTVDSVDVTPDHDSNLLRIKIYGKFNTNQVPTTTSSLLVELNLPVRSASINV